MTDKRAVISLRDVRKSYSAFELGPIDLDIHPGCVVAIVGHPAHIRRDYPLRR
jgi:ABC-type siderophore export system fused ATPase/permease subunit